MKPKLMFMICPSIALIMQHQSSHAQSWSLTGNAGTNPPTHFLGTTDNKSLVLKTNNIERIRITNTGNVGIGTTNPSQKLDVNGNINIASGSGLYINHTKILHIAGSFSSLNFFAGALAGGANTTGYENTACGAEALFTNTSGYNNSASGCLALGLNTTGFNNAASGAFTLTSNTTGYNNTAMGTSALYANTTGYQNTATGFNSLAYSTTGYYNASAGAYALGSNITGYENSALGYGALGSNTRGFRNTAIGSNANVNTNNLSNSTALGYSALVTASNQVRIGNSSVTSIGGYVNWSNISDGRFKKNVKDNVKGLEFIIKLKPVSYNLDITGLNTFQRKNMKEPDAKKHNASEEDAQEIKAKEQIVYNGFVAQDVEKAAKETGYAFSGIDAPKNENDVYGLRYADFVVPLVKAVQELSGQNDALKSENEELKSRLDKIEQMLAVKASSVITSSAARLEQNAPNPFNQNTVINYNLSEDSRNAKIIFTDANGRVIKTIQLNTKGNRQFVLQGGQLAAGTYQYSLIVNEKVVDTKKMVLLR